MTALPSSYLDRAISNELGNLSSKTAGRNNQLFKSAASLYRFSAAGVISEDDITSHLEDAGSNAGLSKDEIRETLRSARRRAASLDETKRAEIREKCTGGHTVTPSAKQEPRAPEPCEPPSKEWRAAAASFVFWSQSQLNATNQSALDYLYSRGLTDKTIRTAGLGYNPSGRWSERAKWGLAPDEDGNERLWLPAGIVLPDYADNALWKIQIRQDKASEKRYKTVTGSRNVLAGVDSLQPGKPAMLVEGPMDRLAVAQAAGDLCGVAACGTTGARRTPWIARLALCSEVLVSFDADAAGDDGAAYWLDALPNARRWRPWYSDPAQMLQDGADVRGWALAGLGKAPRIYALHPEFADFWRECEEHNWRGHIERHKRLCEQSGADYQATIDPLR